MADYLSKLRDAAEMLWTTLGYMERYWTIVAVYLALMALWALARWTAGGTQKVMLVLPTLEAPLSPPEP